MKAVLALLVILSISCFVDANKISESEYMIFDLFQSWQLEHHISYSSTEEELYHFENFKQNYNFIQEYNSQGHSAVLGLNKYSDLSQEERTAIFGHGLKSSTDTNQDLPIFESDITSGALPTTWDWRQKNVVSPVEDCGPCGSTWAFATVWSVESFWAIKNNDNLTVLSVGQVNNCDKNSDACEGGFPSNAFAYVKQYGLETNAEYPYVDHDAKCDYNASLAIKVLNTYAAIPANSPALMQAAVFRTPISVNVGGESQTFVNYKSGILGADCNAQISWCLTVVGWDVVDNQTVWIVKNMLGTSWGMEGYGYIAMNSTINDGKGACGIYTGPIAPIA